jgi:hypothetical protein
MGGTWADKGEQATPPTSPVAVLLDGAVVHATNDAEEAILTPVRAPAVADCSTTASMVGAHDHIPRGQGEHHPGGKDGDTHAPIQYLVPEGTPSPGWPVDTPQPTMDTM